MYLMSEKSGSRSFRATIRQTSSDYDALAVKRGERAPTTLLEFHWKMGARTPKDVVLTDDAEVLVSIRFLKSIEAFPGWSSIPVGLLLPSGESVKAFHSLVVHGRTGAFLQNRTTKLPAVAGKAFDTYRGLCFSVPETFGVGMPSQRLDLVYVSEEFALAVRPYTSESLEFTPCDEVLTDPWTYLSVVEKTAHRT